ncbi:hypothetical protein [Aquirufa rosea]|nr:hypothetical protein [Aquirufa rosea]
MKPNQKPIKTPPDPKSYVLQRKLDILTRVYWMITNTRWGLEHSDVLDRLLDKFIDLSDGLGENKRINLKDLINKDLIHKSDGKKMKK